MPGINCLHLATQGHLDAWHLSVEPIVVPTLALLVLVAMHHIFVLTPPRYEAIRRIVAIMRHTIHFGSAGLVVRNKEPSEHLDIQITTITDHGPHKLAQMSKGGRRELVQLNLVPIQ